MIGVNVVCAVNMVLIISKVRADEPEESTKRRPSQLAVSLGRGRERQARPGEYETPLAQGKPYCDEGDRTKVFPSSTGPRSRSIAIREVVSQLLKKCS